MLVPYKTRLDKTLRKIQNILNIAKIAINIDRNACTL